MINWFKEKIRLVARHAAAETTESIVAHLPPQEEAAFGIESFNQLVLDSNLITAKTYPLDPDAPHLVLKLEDEPSTVPTRPEDFPEPPMDLWEGYHGGEGDFFQQYLNNGKEHVDQMVTLLRQKGFGFDAGSHILELGCAAGRMTRWMLPFAENCSIWGVDVSAPHATWCQQHLSPPFNFMTCSSHPHLPFEDNTFDLVYAGSVFTHISEMPDAWLMELRRITKPGAFLYLTIHDENTIKLLRRDQPDFFLTETLNDLERDTNFIEDSFGMASAYRSPRQAQVFYSQAFIQRIWGQFFSVVDLVEGAYFYQTAAILKNDK